MQFCIKWGKTMLKNRKSLPQDHKHRDPNQPLGCATKKHCSPGRSYWFPMLFSSSFHCHRTKCAIWSQIFTQSPWLLCDWNWKGQTGITLESCWCSNSPSSVLFCFSRQYFRIFERGFHPHSTLRNYPDCLIWSIELRTSVEIIV